MGTMVSAPRSVEVRTGNKASNEVALVIMAGRTRRMLASKKSGERCCCLQQVRHIFECSRWIFYQCLVWAILCNLVLTGAGRCIVV